MAITKRTRFEVLRRDEQTCQYCGAKAPEVELHIDHVVPMALGGSDKPDNLVAACRDCNTGKASISPDSPLVQHVSDHAAAYALGMTDRMTRLRGQIQQERYFAQVFESKWNAWKTTGTKETIPLPPEWRASVARWYRMGVPLELFEDAIDVAMRKPFLRGEYAEFSYMAGVIWGRINEHEIDYSLTEETVHTYTKFEFEDAEAAARKEAYDEGFKDGTDHANQTAEEADLVALLIDGQTDTLTWQRLSYVA